MPNSAVADGTKRRHIAEKLAKIWRRATVAARNAEDRLAAMFWLLTRSGVSSRMPSAGALAQWREID